MKIANVMISDAWGGINPGALDTGIGGREGALLRLSREWAKLGHEVTNFVRTEQRSRFEESETGYHEYVDVRLARSILRTFPYDAVIAWECPHVFNDEQVKELQPVRLVEMQVAHFVRLGIDERQMAQDHATGVIALSDWHADFLVHEGLEMEPDRIHVLPNCVSLDLYPSPGDPEERRKQSPPQFVYSSSPDRGLVHVLKAWPQIRGIWPGATLKVAYGAKKWTSEMIWGHYKQGEVAVDIAMGIQQPGVEDVGKIGQDQLSKIQRESTAMLYPCDTLQPTETGCISIIESMAAGCPVITSDCDCLAEEFGDAAMIDGLPFREDEYLGAMSAVLEDKDLYKELAVKGRELAEERQWLNVAPRWIELFAAEQARL